MNYIISSCVSTKQTRLLKFYETRWIEYLNSQNLFYDVYKYICSSLTDFDEKNMMDTTLFSNKFYII